MTSKLNELVENLEDAQNAILSEVLNEVERVAVKYDLTRVEFSPTKCWRGNTCVETPRELVELQYIWDDSNGWDGDYDDVWTEEYGWIPYLTVGSP